MRNVQVLMLLNIFSYLYPQKLLCKQFWTPRQKAIFNEAKFNNNLVLHDRVIINLKEQIENSLTRRDNLAKNVSIDLIDKVLLLIYLRSLDLNKWLINCDQFLSNY